VDDGADEIPAALARSAVGFRGAHIAMTKVSAVRIENHDALAEGFRAALRQAPGLLPDVLPKQALIKPNLCDITAWETGVTTDPRWLGVLTGALRAIRPDIEIRAIESDAISAYKTYRSCDETFERLGFRNAAEQAGVELINLSRSETIELQMDGLPLPVRIPQIFLEEMFFISVANLKVHGYTRMTGVLKNSLGLLTDADISAFHPYLSTLISRMSALCPADLCIIDGRIGLEGHGPIMGDPVRMDTLLVGRDALAVDQAACRLMGIPVSEVPHVEQTAKDLGRALGDFEIVGEFRPRRFEFDSTNLRPVIETKFASRRLHHRMAEFSNLWIDRAYRLKREPGAFMKSAFARLRRAR
jgi:uncharacterized protein (DUF362 family)